jgi:hypothetical protein
VFCLVLSTYIGSSSFSSSEGNKITSCFFQQQTVEHNEGFCKKASSITFFRRYDFSVEAEGGVEV